MGKKIWSLSSYLVTVMRGNKITEILLTMIKIRFFLKKKKKKIDLFNIIIFL